MEAKEALRELIKRRITNTFKKALDEAEPLMYSHSYDHFRHKVLDCGNDQIRMLMDDLDKFDVKWGTKREVFVCVNGSNNGSNHGSKNGGKNGNQ